jgi:uncharacterized protein with beta-barrel porin domain
MSRTRLAAVAATLTCAFMLVGGTGIASAQTAPATQQLAKTINVTGTAKNGKKMTAKYTIDRFIAKGNKTYALGTLKGKVGRTHFTKKNVKMPVTQSTGAAAAQATSCQVLDLVINPINLNLLGLVVHTDTIHLNITAVPGAGNLLGNLLCGILGILNPPTGGTGGLTGAQLAQLLNAILGALTPVLGG